MNRLINQLIKQVCVHKGSALGLQNIAGKGIHKWEVLYSLVSLPRLVGEHRNIAHNPSKFPMKLKLEGCMKAASQLPDEVMLKFAKWLARGRESRRGELSGMRVAIPPKC